MAIKKVANKVVAEEVTSTVQQIFNEYGVCIDCQGGIEECLHNNLTETNVGTFCVLCGLQVK